MRFHRFSPKFIRSVTAKKTEILVVLGPKDPIPERYRTPERTRLLDERFKKKKPASLEIDAPNGSIETLHILRLAKNDEILDPVAEKARSLKGSALTLDIAKSLDAAKAIEGFGLGIYRFDTFLSRKKPKTAEIVGRKTRETELAARRVDAVYLARDLVNLPSNEKYPEKFAEYVGSLSWRNTKVRVLGRKELEKEGFGMLLSVSAGSDREPKVIVFERKGNKTPPEYAFVGKGVTFDAGGIQIKPDDAMFDMKCDMAGAAAVVASVWFLDQSDDVPRGYVGAIGLTENMTGGSASKPLDIVRAHNGLSVEIHHTDAEGRLVLGDLVSYVGSTYAPKKIVTVATLTGACLHALGYDYAGISGTSDALVRSLVKNSKNLPEKLWQLPLDERMLESTKAEIADRKSISKSMKAGSSLGAAFIAQFVPKKVAYAHLDIAGPAYLSKARGIYPEGGTGFGVYTLNRLIEE